MIWVARYFRWAPTERLNELNPKVQPDAGQLTMMICFGSSFDGSNYDRGQLDSFVISFDSECETELAQI